MIQTIVLTQITYNKDALSFYRRVVFFVFYFHFYYNTYIIFQWNLFQSNSYIIGPNTSMDCRGVQFNYKYCMYWSRLEVLFARRVRNYPRNLYIKEEQTTQWPKENVQTTIYKTYKTKDWVTRTPLKTGGELMCSGRVGSSCSTSDIACICLGFSIEMF